MSSKTITFYQSPELNRLNLLLQRLQAEKIQIEIIDSLNQFQSGVLVVIDDGRVFQDSEMQALTRILSLQGCKVILLTHQQFRGNRVGNLCQWLQSQLGIKVNDDLVIATTDEHGDEVLNIDLPSHVRCKFDERFSGTESEFTYIEGCTLSILKSDNDIQIMLRTPDKAYPPRSPIALRKDVPNGASIIIFGSTDTFGDEHVEMSNGIQLLMYLITLLDQTAYNATSGVKSFGIRAGNRPKVEPQTNIRNSSEQIRLPFPELGKIPQDLGSLIDNDLNRFDLDYDALLKEL
ncbi:hypothetical protein MP228_003501 [Amoeboaphelidium protococcarum]|nr:hypothetical protein MP228_003501 [Amoeboaphelidium protococcarum]